MTITALSYVHELFLSNTLELPTAIERHSDAAFEAGELSDDGQHVRMSNLDEDDDTWKWDKSGVQKILRCVATSAWGRNLREMFEGGREICSIERYYEPGFTWNKPRDDAQVVFYEQIGLMEWARCVEQLEATGGRCG